MNRNDMDKNKWWKPMRKVPYILIIGIHIFLGIVVFWVFSNQPALMPDLTPLTCSAAVLLAYGLGAMFSGFLTIRVTYAIMWAVLVLALTAVLFCVIPRTFYFGYDVSLDELLGHLTDVALPGVILILFLVFRREIQRRLQRVTGIDAFGVRASFSQEGRVSSLALTSFDDLMRAVSDMIRSAEPWDTIRFTAYTPALGYLARAEREWKELRHVLKLNAHRVSMTCLDEKHLTDWHRGFVKKVTRRGPVSEKLADQATTASENLLSYITREPGRNTKRINPGKEPFLHRYLFASKTRAIVVVPFFVPRFLSKAGEPELGLLGQGDDEPDEPEMLGFVTDDPRLVDMVCRAHDRDFHGVETRRPVTGMEATSED